MCSSLELKKISCFGFLHYLQNTLNENTSQMNETRRAFYAFRKIKLFVKFLRKSFYSFVRRQTSRTCKNWNFKAFDVSRRSLKSSSSGKRFLRKYLGTVVCQTNFKFLGRKSSKLKRNNLIIIFYAYQFKLHMCISHFLSLLWTSFVSLRKRFSHHRDNRRL